MRSRWTPWLALLVLGAAAPPVLSVDKAAQLKGIDPCTGCVVGSIRCGEVVQDVLSRSRCLLGDGTFLDVWRFDLAAPEEVRVELESQAFDTFLFLIDGSCELIDLSDDCGATTDSCLTLPLPAGRYFIGVNTFFAGEEGAYRLSVACSDSADICGVDCTTGSVSCGEAIGDSLRAGDCAFAGGAFFDAWELEIASEAEVAVFLRSDVIDPKLLLLDSSCTLLELNDDWGVELNSAIVTRLAAGTYFLIATSFAAGEVGPYSLDVLRCDCDGPPVPADPVPAQGAFDVPVDIGRLAWGVEEPALARRSRVIYGADDRLDLFELSDPELEAAAEATVAAVDVQLLRDNRDGTFTLDTVTLAEDILVREGLPLCPEERFAEQPVAAFCSGFLAAPDIVATAGHCIVDDLDCKTVAFIFGFAMVDADTPTLTFEADDVYFCAGVIGSVSTDTVDWALVVLDRPVTGRAPLAVRDAGRVADGAELVVLGHPLGLPLKVAGGARVRDNRGESFFIANLDTYAGNSGSPVLNLDTLEVEGILVRGEEDLVVAGNRCMASKVCPDDGCTGEQATRATAFADIIARGVPELVYDVYIAEGDGPLEFLGTTPVEEIPLPVLAHNTDYFWKVVARNACRTMEGPLWFFTTEPMPAPATSVDDDDDDGGCTSGRSGKPDFALLVLAALGTAYAWLRKRWTRAGRAA